MTIKKILNTEWLIIFFIFVLFPPAYLKQNTFADTLLDGLLLFVSVVVAIMYFANVKVHVKKSFNLLFIILWIELLISTLCSERSSIYQYTVNVLYSFATCFLIEEIALHSPAKGIKVMYWYFSVCVLINTVTVFLFPTAMYANNRGLWRCWFLGEDNAAYVYYVIASMVAMIYTQYISKRITILSSLVWVSSFIFVFHNDIATGIVCQIIWTILVLGYQFGWFRKLLKARYVLYAIVGGFVAVVLLRGLIFEPIVSALGRNSTLTGRTLLWDRVLEIIQERPVLGFGIYTGEEFDRIAMNNGIVNAHNWLLMLMFYGGIIAVVLFSLTVICSYRDAQMCRSSPFYRCMVIGLIVLAVRFFVEAGQLQIMFMMLAILAYSKEFTQGLENVQVKKRFVIKGVPRIRVLRRRSRI